MDKYPVPMPLPEEMIRICKRKQRLRKGRILLGSLAALWLLLAHTFLIYRNQGLAMFPAARAGDWVLACRVHQTYREGDMVVYCQDGERYLGRIGAVAGDVVQLDEDGNFLVNGSIRNRSLYPTYPRRNADYSQQIPEGRVFLLGDFRIRSRDSRDFGPVSLEEIQGKVILLVRSREL